MFRGEESSNRIELSRLVQDLLNFGVLASLRLWGVRGWMDGGGGVVGGVPNTCAHTCACTHAHACMLNMIISCKWPPPLGESMGIPYDVICMCACVCVHACTCVNVYACAHVWGAPSCHPHPHPHPPTPHPLGGTPGISRNSIALELIEIFQFRLKI